MSIKDRTNEFRATLESVHSRNMGLGVPLISSGKSAPGKGRHALSEFMQRAIPISNDIRGLLGKLEKLAKLARSKSIFEDRPAEVQELTHIVQRELTRIKERIEDLRKYRDSTVLASGANRNSAEHATTVVTGLQSRLARATSDFTKVLNERTENIKKQRDRREQFGAAAALPVLPSPTLLKRPIGYNPAFEESEGNLPSAHARSGRSSPQHTVIDMGMQQELGMVEKQDMSYYQGRSEAIRGIESTINELGQVFQQLSHMISEQGEVVGRIDANIEQVHENVSRGQAQLLRYLQRISSNRWLMVKIFGVLILFIILFTLFF